MFCSKCGKEIQDNQKLCPSCGSPINDNNVNNTPSKEKPKNKNNPLSIIAGIVFVGALFYIFSSDKHKEEPSSPVQEQPVTKKSNVVKVEGSGVAYEIIDPYIGNSKIMFKCENNKTDVIFTHNNIISSKFSNIEINGDQKFVRQYDWNVNKKVASIKNPIDLMKDIKKYGKRDIFIWFNQMIFSDGDFKNEKTEVIFKTNEFNIIYDDISKSCNWK